MSETSIWGGDNPSVAWNQNSFQSNIITIELTGISATSSIGTVEAFPEQGWGSDSWGDENWGESALTVVVDASGVSASTALGTVQAFNVNGWGRQQWSNSGWGVEYSVEPTGLSATVSQGTATGAPITIVEVTGISATASVGDISPEDAIGVSGQVATSALGELTSVGTAVGWGRNGWGEEPYGDSFNKVIVATIGTQAAANVGSIAPADVMGLTGVSSTASIGSATMIGNVTVTPTGLSITSSVGTLDPSDQVMGLTGIAATSAVGSITPADLTFGITGVSATIDIGETGISSNPIIIPTGLSATSAVGSITPADVMGLTGVSATSFVGSISPADIMGLTGVSSTASVGDIFIQAYQAIDTGSNTSYTSVATGSNTSYSDVA